MKLSPERFNAHLRHLGQRATWQRAHTCPCRDAYSGAAQPGCPHCAGKGWQWALSCAVHLAIAGIQRQRQWAQMGLYESGDAVATLPSDDPSYAMGEFDRVALTDTSDAFSTTLVRGAADERLNFAVTQWDQVFYLNGQGTPVFCVLPTQNANRTLTWPASGVTPPTGQRYSLTGRKTPEYFVWGDLVQTRPHHDGLALPRHVVLRRFDLFGR